jgi:hypothetical protein
MRGSPNYVMEVADNLRQAVHEVCTTSQARALNNCYETTRDMGDALNQANILINDLERLAKL